MLNFTFLALGVGLVGNENVYFGALLRFNDHTSALVIIKESDTYSDIVNTMIGDVKQMWEGSYDFAAVMNKINRYTKYRIMPFTVPYATPNTKISVDQLAIECKARCMKFFKEADILIKDTKKDDAAEATLIAASKDI